MTSGLGDLDITPEAYRPKLQLSRILGHNLEVGVVNEATLLRMIPCCATDAASEEMSLSW